MTYAIMSQLLLGILCLGVMVQTVRLMRRLALPKAVLAKLPPLDEDDTLVFLGDYLDRGPESRQVIAFVRHELPFDRSSMTR